MVRVVDDNDFKIAKVPAGRLATKGYTTQDRNRAIDNTKIQISLKMTNLLVLLYVGNFVSALLITLLQGLGIIQLDLGYYVTTFLTTISIATIPTLIMRLLNKK